MEREIKKLKNFKKWFNEFVKNNYGRKCSDFIWGCHVCYAYFVKQVLDDFTDDLIETEKWFKKQKKSPKIKGK